MKKFKNINTGLIEIVTNEMVIEQYEKHSDIYVAVDDKKTKDTKSSNKKDKPVEKDAE